MHADSGMQTGEVKRVDMHVSGHCSAEELILVIQSGYGLDRYD